MSGIHEPMRMTTMPDSKKKKCTDSDTLDMQPNSKKPRWTETVPLESGPTTITGIPPGEWREHYSNTIGHPVVVGVPASMDMYKVPLVDDTNPGNVNLVFIGASYAQSGGQIQPLPGAQQDLQLFMGSFKDVPDKNVFILTDFKEVAEQLISTMKSTNPKGSYVSYQISKGSIRNVLQLYLPLKHDVTRTVIHVSCHGQRNGFVIPVGSKTEILTNTEFTDWMVQGGKFRKQWWTSASNRVFIPLHMTLYIDRCFAGNAIPMQWVFCVQTTCIHRVMDENPTMRIHDITHPDNCHMLIVCLSACTPESKTVESKSLLSGDVACGMFSYLMHSPTAHKTRISNLVHGWYAFNAHTFSMVPLIWFRMDKNVCARIKTGFYWSTNVECAGTENLRIRMPTDNKGGLLWNPEQSDSWWINKAKWGYTVV